jgi:hypothetical protein
MVEKINEPTNGWDLVVSKHCNLQKLRVGMILFLLKKRL